MHSANTLPLRVTVTRPSLKVTSSSANPSVIGSPSYTMKTGCHVPSSFCSSAAIAFCFASSAVAGVVSVARTRKVAIGFRDRTFIVHLPRQFVSSPRIRREQQQPFAGLHQFAQVHGKPPPVDRQQE